jgi:streptogramin lyase
VDLRRRGTEIRVLGAIAGVLLLVSAIVGCGGDVGEQNVDGRGGERDGAANGEATAPGGGRPASGAARGGAGLGVEVLSPGGDYVPVGYGGGSLWATEPSTCNDTGSASGSPSSSGGASFPSTMIMESSAQAMCAMPGKMVLKRLDPRTGEEEATIRLDDFFAETPDVAVGAGSVWVSSADGAADAVLKVDTETNRVVDRLPVPAAESATSLAFGRGSVWIASSERDTVWRADPRTEEVTAKIEVGRGALDVAVDGGTGDVWVAFGGGYKAKKLSRVDPEAGRVVAEVPIAEQARYGGAWTVAAGEGAVWAQSADGGELFKVDPATNEVVAERDLGDYSSDLAVYGGSVWAVNQVTVGTRLYRVDPRTTRVVASEHGPDPSEGGFGGVYGELVAGGGYVWFQSENRLSRVAP